MFLLLSHVPSQSSWRPWDRECHQVSQAPIKMARKSLTLVSIGQVIIEAPEAPKHDAHGYPATGEFGFCLAPSSSVLTDFEVRRQFQCLHHT